MVEMEVHGGPPVRAFRSYPIRVPPQHETGEAAHAVLAVADLVVGRTPLGKFERIAVIGQADVEVELVEARGDKQRPVLAIFSDRIDQLGDAEDGALDDVRPRAPGAALLDEEILDS